MRATCPECGAHVPVPGRTWSLPVGRVLALIGGLALVAAYFMPWFATQGLILTGHFLGQFLGSTNDLRRFMPGATGGAAEVQMLRALVFLFPAAGGLAGLLALAGLATRRLRTPTGLLAIIAALVSLAALIGGVTRLPGGASIEIGLWLIGAGALAVLLGSVLDLWLIRPLSPSEASAP